jgi:membrane-associated phospholipid phosphatase
MAVGGERIVAAGGARAGAVADRLAHAVSVVCAPPSLAVPLVGLAAHRAAGQPGAWAAATLLIATTAVLPSLFILAAKRAGYVGSLDLTRRAERVLPSLFAALCAATVYPTLLRWEAPEVLVALSAAIALQLGALALVTTVWKVSYHAAGAGGLAAIAYTLEGAALGVGLLLLAALVAWARVRLGRHTRAQVVVGLLTSTPVLLVERAFAGALG